MTPEGERLRGLLAERLGGDHVLGLDLGAPGDLVWTEVAGGIEADLGARTVRFESNPATVILTNKQFGSAKRIPI